jgi:hypothetical protein
MRASGTFPQAAMIAKLAAAVSNVTGVCSSSTVNQSKLLRAISPAAVVLGNVSQVPTVGSPRFSFSRT